MSGCVVQFWVIMSGYVVQFWVIMSGYVVQFFGDYVRMCSSVLGWLCQDV